jgi:hypothetical protein
MQICGDTPDLLVIKSAQFFLSPPSIAYTGKQCFDGGMGRH